MRVLGNMFVGQSMASTTIDFELAMKYWWMEKDDYTFGLDYKEQMYQGVCGFMVGHYTQVCVYLCVCVYVYMCMCMYVCACVYVCTCVCICVYVCVHVCMCLCVCVCVP